MIVLLLKEVQSYLVGTKPRLESPAPMPYHSASLPCTLCWQCAHRRSVQLIRSTLEYERTILHLPAPSSLLGLRAHEGHSGGELRYESGVPWHTRC
eukprot:COSAG02_NODE_1084_length_14692_cov_214.338724_7_plen_96_part_00